MRLTCPSCGEASEISEEDARAKPKVPCRKCFYPIQTSTLPLFPEAPPLPSPLPPAAPDPSTAAPAAAAPAPIRVEPIPPPPARAARPIPRLCPYCRTPLQTSAVKCPHCGEWVPEGFPAGRPAGTFAADARDHDNFAIAGFVCSLSGLFPLFFLVPSVLGIVFSSIALHRMSRSGKGRGRGLAQAGLILGILPFAGIVAYFLCLAVVR